MVEIMISPFGSLKKRNIIRTMIFLILHTSIVHLRYMTKNKIKNQITRNSNKIYCHQTEFVT